MRECARPKCGKSFDPATPKQQYCSDNCRKYHNKEKKTGVSADIASASPVITKPAGVKEAIKHAGTRVVRELPPRDLPDKAARIRWFKEHK